MTIFITWRVTVVAAVLALMAVTSTAIASQKVLETQKGSATYYAKKLGGKKTASGEILDNSAMVAAHRSWPFGTKVRVTATETEKSVVVTIVDRIGQGSEDVVIDLSRAAAKELNFLVGGEGKIPVSLEVIEWGAK